MQIKAVSTRVPRRQAPPPPPPSSSVGDAFAGAAWGTALVGGLGLAAGTGAVLVGSFGAQVGALAGPTGALAGAAAGSLAGLYMGVADVSMEMQRYGVNTQLGPTLHDARVNLKEQALVAGRQALEKTGAAVLGATVGSALLGPAGAVGGGLLGWSMVG